MRLNHDCDNFQDVVVYFKERANQMVLNNFKLKSIRDFKDSALAIFERNGKEYHSIYIYNSHRNKGIYHKMMFEILPSLDIKPNIVTSRDCNIENYLKKMNIKYSTFLGFTDYLEYQYIDQEYGKETTKRSKIPFMNHIDEGLAILHWIGASLEAKKAYCLHPMYQSDEMITKYGIRDMREISIFGIGANVITNAVEYRHTANNYLSTRKIESIDEIVLSPLKDVNDMLIADKIQNRKDFELHHEGTHPRSYELTVYFRKWLEKLEVSEEDYQEYKRKLSLEEIELM